MSPATWLSALSHGPQRFSFVGERVKLVLFLDQLSQATPAEIAGVQTDQDDQCA
jgi:hypothetical protein